MTKRQVATKIELLADLEHAWTALNAVLEQLSEAQMSSAPDGQGWTVKDHIIHLTAWERSVVFFLRGQPRSAGLGVEWIIYEQGSDDEINAVIYRQRHLLPLSDALAQFHDVHRQLLTLLFSLSDADLQLPYHAYLADEEDNQMAINLIYINTVHHFREHLGLIKLLVSREPSPLARRDAAQY